MTSRVTEKNERKIPIAVADKTDDFDNIAAINCLPEEEEKS